MEEKGNEGQQGDSTTVGLEFMRFYEFVSAVSVDFSKMILNSFARIVCSPLPPAMGFSELSLLLG